MENKYLRGKHVVLRQEFDNWGILFDADSGEAYVVDPVAICIWQQLDGEKTVSDILQFVKENFTETPEEDLIYSDSMGFINDLIKHGLVSINRQIEA